MLTYLNIFCSEETMTFIYVLFKRRKAKLLLRKKKYQEGLLDRTDGQLDNLERLVQDLEFAQVEKQVR